MFEKQVNDDMQHDGQPGRAPSHELESKTSDRKAKAHPPPQPQHEDEEIHEKGDLPPRFSTLFGTMPTPRPAAQHEVIREYIPEPKRKAGVFMPMPLFILFAAILFFESTILFAYTIVGLYNNAPSRIFPWAGPGTASAVCETGQKSPAINIAPNFVMPGGADAVTQYVTVTAVSTVTASTSSSSTTTTTTTSSTSSSSTSTSTTSTSSVNASSQAAAMASDIAQILDGLQSRSSSTTSSTSVAIVTIGPAPSTVTSVKLITQGASGEAQSAGAQPTVTQTTFVDPPRPTD
jgi:hypothetical protein